MSIAPQNETAWYREYWLKVAAACLTGFALIEVGLLVGLYFVVKWASLAAMNEYANQFTVK